MKTMDYKNEESIDNFVDSFVEDRYKRTKLNSKTFNIILSNNLTCIL